MKWGVRKDREVKGSNRKKSVDGGKKVITAEELYEETGYDPASWKDTYHSEYIDAWHDYVNILDHLSESQALIEFVYDRKPDILNDLDKMSKLDDKCMDFDLSSSERDAARKEFVELVKTYSDLEYEFNTTHMNDMTEEEIEFQKQWAEMVDYITGLRGSVPDGAILYMFKDAYGKPTYYYTERDGTKHFFKKGEETGLVKAIAEDKKKGNIDFRKTVSGRTTREKNVVSNTPVKVTKSEKPANIGAGERTIKKLLYGSDEDKQRIITDYQRMIRKNDSKKQTKGGKATSVSR